ncbi:MAG: MFS transporter [Clostridia bacterium]|nr:MFS transporter [Clostridia bacterium]
MNRSTLLSRDFWNKDFILICLVCCIASYPNSILTSVLPVYVLDIGGNNAVIGFMTTGLTVLTMITNIIVAPLIDSIGRKRLVILGSFLFFVNSLLFCFTNRLSFVLVLRILCGLTTGVFFPIPPIIVSDVSKKEHLVDALGIFGASGSVSFAVAPTIGLWLYRSYGATAMFCSAAVLGAISFMDERSI